jgi:DNA processing protein
MHNAERTAFEKLRFAYSMARGTGLPNAALKSILLSTSTWPSSLNEAREAIYRLMPAHPGTDLATQWNGFERVIEQHRLEKVEMIAITDPRYPASLRAIVDPPPILYCRGDVALLARLPGAAVVGTRKASETGLVIARRVAAFLSTNGYVVVSGLALGIDAAAHQGALSVKAPNIAVLAHGLHRYAPPRNAPLAEEILATGGLVVSEHPLGAQPEPRQFVARNRIQIGLSAGSVIVEGDVKSGTMTQAEFCVREKRALFAVVPDETTASLGLFSAGPQSLVAAGRAHPVTGKKDYDLMLVRLSEVRETLLRQGQAN